MEYRHTRLTVRGDRALLSGGVCELPVWGSIQYRLLQCRLLGFGVAWSDASKSCLLWWLPTVQVAAIDVLGPHHLSGERKRYLARYLVRNIGAAAQWQGSSGDCEPATAFLVKRHFRAATMHTRALDRLVKRSYGLELEEGAEERVPQPSALSALWGLPGGLLEYNGLPGQAPAEFAKERLLWAHIGQ